MYNLSRDYNALFKLLCEGETALGFVKAPSWCGVGAKKDPCMIIRSAPFDIFIGVRGNGYGSIHKFQKDQGDECEMFASVCMFNELEWVMPNAEVNGAARAASRECNERV